MGTQLDEARLGRITPAMRAAARSECVDPGRIREQIALGRAVLPANPKHRNLEPAIVGRAFRTKINANIGRSVERSSTREEMRKLKTVVSAGADFVMDLSVGPGTNELRRKMVQQSPLPIGTVPIYEAFWMARGDVAGLTAEMLTQAVRRHAEQGVDFMTIHAGLLKAHVPLAVNRVMGIVSRGGSILAEWMVHHHCENPLYARWDEILEICHEHDVTISLGDGLRPGCLADASDKAQFAELDVLGKLVLRCRKRGVQVMVEGPGHVPFNQIRMNMEREQRRCHHAPFYVLGPVVTDIAPAYDHITSSIGSTAAAYYGASLLCYVTPSEHLGLPTIEDVRAGIVAHRIAAHAADVARNLPGSRDRDDAMARARIRFDWEKQFKLAIDGDAARKKHIQAKTSRGGHSDYCSMCGETFCAMRTTRRFRRKMRCGRLRSAGREGGRHA